MERSKKHRSAQPGAFSAVASVFVVLCGCLLAVSVANGQSDQQTSAYYCAFEDGKQLSVRYVPAQLTNKPPREGVVWSPGGSPAILFSEADLEVAGVSLPVGAYALYIIPGKEQWTMIVNKDVAAGAKYNKSADLVRIPMQTAKLGRPVDRLQIVLGREAPKQCNVRVYYDTVGAFGVELNEK
ncbi:MAG TPA: DUF2911 domain-containing protein [Terriglobales bacterium]|nr:DUF2911 domain-containing protein [Terriglobales bacterium]